MGYHLERSFSLYTNMSFVCECMQWKQCSQVDVMDSNFGLVSQGQIVDCPGDNYNGEEIPEGCFSILVHKVWVQDVKLQYPNLAGNHPQVRMKDSQFAPILWRKEDLVL